MGMGRSRWIWRVTVGVGGRHCEHSCHPPSPSPPKRTVAPPHNDAPSGSTPCRYLLREIYECTKNDHFSFKAGSLSIRKHRPQQQQASNISKQHLLNFDNSMRKEIIFQLRCGLRCVLRLHWLPRGTVEGAGDGNCFSRN